MFVYVDDILLLGPSMKAIDGLKRKLNENRLRTVQHYLGMKMTRDRQQRTLTVSQKTYLEGVLDHFGFSDLRPAAIPMERGFDLKAFRDRADAAFIEQYQSTVASLMYAMTQTRPDIAYSISRFSRNWI